MNVTSYPVQEFRNLIFAVTTFVLTNTVICVKTHFETCFMLTLILSIAYKCVQSYWKTLQCSGILSHQKSTVYSHVFFMPMTKKIVRPILLVLHFSLSGIHRWTVDSRHKGQSLQKVCPCHDVIMNTVCSVYVTRGLIQYENVILPV